MTQGHIGEAGDIGNCRPTKGQPVPALQVLLKQIQDAHRTFYCKLMIQLIAELVMQTCIICKRRLDPMLLLMASAAK